MTKGCEKHSVVNLGVCSFELKAGAQPACVQCEVDRAAEAVAENQMLRAEIARLRQRITRMLAALPPKDRK